LAADISLLTAFATLAIVDRVRATQRAEGRLFWTMVGALSMGTGIWATHFTGMLAWHGARSGDLATARRIGRLLPARTFTVSACSSSRTAW